MGDILPFSSRSSATPYPIGGLRRDWFGLLQQIDLAPQPIVEPISTVYMLQKSNLDGLRSHFSKLFFFFKDKIDSGESLMFIFFSYFNRL